MLKFTREDEIDFKLYEHRLRYVPHIYLNTIRMKQMMDTDIIEERSLRDRAEHIMRVDSSGQCVSLGDDYTKYVFLTQHQYCPSHYFERTKNARGFSVARQYLERAYEKGYAHEFLEAYLKFRTIEKKTDKVNKIIEKSYNHRDRGNRGEILNRLDFKVEQQQNFRYNYNSYDIITIPKDYSKCVSVPQGKIMVWGDFAQADFRVAYNLLIRDEENQKIMDKCDDKYEGLARIIAYYNNESFDIIKFKEERKMYKVCTLAAVYGKRTGETKEETQFMQRLGAFLDKCPRYVEFRKRIKDRLHLNKPVMLDTYFGLPIAVPHERGYGKDPVNKALNTPIQSGTSQIVILTVNAILDRFYALGYSEDDIHVYYVRHDEPIFIMDRKVMKDCWVFKDCSHILIDDWTPLTADFFFGYDYTEADETLMSDYKELSNANRFRFNIEEPSPHFDEPIYLIKKTKKMALGIADTYDDGTVVCFYDYEGKETSYIKIPSQDKNVVYEEIEKRLCTIDARIYDKGFNGAYIKTRGFNKEVFYTSMFFKYKEDIDADLRFAECLAEHMAYSYAKRNGIEVTPSDMCVANYERMKNVEMVDIFSNVEGE